MKDAILVTEKGYAEIVRCNSCQTPLYSSSSAEGKSNRSFAADNPISWRYCPICGAPITAEEPKQNLQEDELPQYTGAEIRRDLSVDDTFRDLLRRIQERMGRMLSSEETMTTYGIYRDLGFPPDLVLLLVDYCISETQRRYGPGRLPAMRFIKSVAFEWEKEGIDSTEMANAYIEAKQAYRSNLGPFAEALKIYGRKLAPTEKEYIDAWIKLGFREDAAEIAYDRVVTRFGSLKWKYMDAIFRSWHNRGLHTSSQILEGDTPSGRTKAHAEQREPENRITQEDIDRMEAYLKRTQKQEDV